MQRTLLLLLAIAVAALVGWFSTLERAPVLRERGGPIVGLDLDGPLMLQGQVQLDPRVPSGSVTLRMTYLESGGSARLQESVDGAGSFAFEGLAPGKVRLEVLAPGAREPLAVRDELALPVQETVAFDLRGMLMLTEVEVSLPTGEPAPEAMVAWRASGDGPFDHFGLAKDGQLVLATGVDVLDLYVQAKEARSQLVRGVIGSTRVELRPGLSVTLGLPAGLDPVADGVQLRGSVVRSEPPKILEDALRGIVDYLRLVDRIDLSGGGSVPVEVPSSGVYRVEWRLFGKQDDRFLPFPGSPEPSTFAVRASTPGATVIPPFPESLYRAAIER